MGVGNFLFVPMSLALGRRPMAIFCSILMTGSIIWAAKSTSFNSHLGARCLQGLTAGISDCLLPLIVLDITFLHNRGMWMTLYWSVTAIGSSLMLVAVPFLVHTESSNWRVNYWFWLGWAVLALILAITCLRETMFYRAPALLNGQLIHVDAYGQVRFEADAADPHRDQTHPETTPSEKKTSRSYIKQLFYTHRQPHSRFHTFMLAYQDMLTCLTHPAVIWTLLLNSLLFAGLVILSITYEQTLQSPPWSFSSQLVGTVQLGAALGATVAQLTTGTLVERTVEFLVRRNNNNRVREPEHLLPSFILPVTFGFLGLSIYGIVGGHPQQHSWVGIHASFALYYCAFVSLSALSSMWVAELTPKRAGPAIVLICGGRNAASFGIRYVYARPQVFLYTPPFPAASPTSGCFLWFSRRS
jgi:Major Facilitator Superfamily